MWMASGKFICQTEPNVLRWNVPSRVDWIWNQETKTCIIRVDYKVVQRQRTNL